MYQKLKKKLILTINFAHRNTMTSLAIICPLTKENEEEHTLLSAPQILSHLISFFVVVVVFCELQANEDRTRAKLWGGGVKGVLTS